MRHTQLYFETKKPQFWVLDPSICLKKLSIGSRFKNLLSCVYWRSRLKKKAGWVVNKAIQRRPHEKASRLHNKYRADGTGNGSGPGDRSLPKILADLKLFQSKARGADNAHQITYDSSFEFSDLPTALKYSSL